MSDDSGRDFGYRSEVEKPRRKRVQKRKASGLDSWGTSQNEVSHHSLKRMRRYRFRRALWIFQAVGWLCLGLATPYGVKWALDKFVSENQSMALAHLEIETNGSLSEAAVAKVAGVRAGDSLIRLDPKTIRERLMQLPFIEEVEVTRHFPDRLAIRVKERSAVAWISCPDHGIKPLRDSGYLMDRSGVPFPCGKMTEQLARLPTIEVEGISRPVAGAPVESFQISESLRLIDANRRIFPNREMEIIDIRALQGWGLLCRYPNDLLVTFDINRIDQGLDDLERILEKSESSNFSLATVNLVTVKNIPVTFHSK